MEVRVQKKKKRFPWDGKKLHTVWKAVAAILVICVLAGGILLIAGRRQQAEAALDPTRYSKEHPFVVLEIVPYEGQGQWGYLVEGQEPVTVEAINGYYTEEQELKDYWSLDWGNNNATFFIEFPFSGLVRDKENRRYANNNIFVKNILCQSGKKAEDWAGKVQVRSESACDITVQDVERADLIIVQSNESAYKYNQSGGDNRNPLYAYWKYNKPSVILKDEKGKVIEPNKGGQAVYEGSISEDNGNSWKSMDMQWDAALAVLDHAYTNNKATIVASEKSAGNADKNIDKLILLLTKLSGKAYIDDGIKEMITTAVNGEGVRTGSFNGETSWNEKLFYDAVLLDRTTFTNSFEKLKYFIYNPSEQYAPPDNVKTFLERFRTMGSLSNEDFYEFMDSELWDALLKYARLLRDKEGSAGKITEEDYQAFENYRVKYEKHQICKLEDKYEAGYDLLHNGGYIGKTKWDNVIRYMEGWISYPFVPVLLGESSKHQIDVEEILLGGAVTPDGPPQEAADGRIKVLEIEPSNNYWLVIPENLSKLATAIGEDEDEISVTYVTPNTLNGMAVDLTAEYDLILIGEDTSLFRAGGPYSSGIPYRHNGYLDDAVIPQTLLNGLLAGDYTTKAKFDAGIAMKKEGASLNTGSYPLTVSSSRYWNPGLREQWPKTPDYYFLKNVELALELQVLGADESVSKARFSGNDISSYMQRQLAEFVKSGQPVIVADRLLVDARKQIGDFIFIDMDSRPYEEELDLDARLYFALYGMEDERDYYTKAPEETYYNRLISMRTGLEEAAGKTISLMKDYKPSIVVKDTGLIKDENGNAVSSIAEKGWSPETKPDLTALARTNTLTFDYEITLPIGDQAENMVMTIIVDRNGDGIFDEAGDGGNGSGKPGKENNSTDYIKNDQVFTVKFGDLPPGDYTFESGLLKGRYTSPVPVESIEEICQFRVQISTLDKNNPLTGVWTGYLHPDTKKKDVKILQITPYSDTAGGKNLSQNPQFVRLFNEAEQKGGEYHIDFENAGFETISEGDFAAECEGKEITAEKLKAYDLIIVGTDFSQELKGDITDTDTLEAAKVLKEYSDTLKKPIIFTNDAFSYVNSENYFAPEEVDYYYRNMTIEEGQREKPTETDPNYKKVRISKEQYEAYLEKNEKEWNDNQHNIGNGTVYLDPEGLHEVAEKAGSYKALVRPTAADDGREISELYIGWQTWGGWFNGGGKEVKTVNPNSPPVKVNAAQFYNEFRNMIDRTFSWIYYFYARNGYVTEGELRSLYEDAGGNPLRTTIKKNTFNVKDLHAALGSYEAISKDIVDETAPIVIAGDTYYKFKSNGADYLSIRLEEDVTNFYGYVWQKKVAGDSDNPVETKYTLNNVAGKGDALYPHKNNWNYFFTQSLRYAVGMDRFAVTTDIKPDDKRDKGSSRRWTKIEQLQGFTNGALLEYAFIPKAGSSYEALVNTTSPYNTQISQNLAIGVKPRTQYIEPLNEGQIGLYPYKIENEVSEAKIGIAENHAPYYQLDLEREPGKGKVDDVTVWYTFAGSGIDDESKYFDTTVRDAGNNYYLYSKGKIYYTGFSLYDDTDESGSDDELVPDMEMKLFINTVYAALNSEAAETSFYDTVVLEGGTVSGIELAGNTGAPNRYTCYYDAYDDKLELLFRVQKMNAADNETVPLAIGKKGEMNEDGLPSVAVFDESAYTIGELPEENTVSSFPVVKVAGEPGQKGSLGSGASDHWYRLEMAFNGDMDGMTIIIGPETPEAGKLRKDSIYAEIRLVKRELFDLD